MTNQETVNRIAKIMLDESIEHRGIGPMSPRDQMARWTRAVSAVLDRAEAEDLHDVEVLAARAWWGPGYPDTFNRDRWNRWATRILDLADEIEEREEARAQTPPPRHTARKVTMSVIYHNGETESFNLTEAGTWCIDTGRRLLIIGRGLPREEIPLDGVRRYILAEE